MSTSFVWSLNRLEWYRGRHSLFFKSFAVFEMDAH